LSARELVNLFRDRERRRRPSRRVPLAEFTSLELLDRRILPAVTAAFSAAHGVLTITGNAHNNTIVVSRKLGGTILVNNHTVMGRGGRATVGNTKLIRVSGLGGNDKLSLNERKGSLPMARIFGGDGNDIITGGSGNDQLFGGSGNDTLIGGGGNDLLIGGGGSDAVNGGDGDDTFVWNPGDGSDAIEGEGGADTLQFNGSDANENIDLSANGSRLRLSSEIGNVTMDVSGVEQVNIAALGGADTITVNDQTATDLVLLNLNLSGSAGSGDGQADSVIVNGTDGDDAVQIAAFENGNRIAVCGLLPHVNISGAEGTNDNVTVNTLGGNDVVDASSLSANLIGLTVNGGAGSDTILGSQGKDVVSGGAGDDVAMLGAGDDTFVWNLGDGRDVVDGGAGADTMRFTGSNASEQIDVSANGGRVRLSRHIGNVTMDLGGIETMNLSAMGGADTITVNDLTGTDLTQLNLDLAGANSTNGDGQPDSVIVNGTNGADRIAIGDSTSGITISGLAASVHISGSEASSDGLTVNALGGNDTIAASGLQAGAITLSLNGGDGNDVLNGSDGNDFVNGGTGDDLASMGAGDDTFVWNRGDGSDSVEGGEGFDTMVFDGSNADEQIDVSANGGRIRFLRNVGTVTMDLNGVEAIDFQALGGADTITVNDLTGTDVTELNLDLASAGGSGVGNASADAVIVNGTDGDDALTVAGDASGVSVIGFSARMNITGAETANDRLTINTLGGDDVMDASGLSDAAIPLAANGGDGNDNFIGGAGNDTLIGGAGDDTLVGGPGLDVLDGGPGDNVLIQD
jgi:Ca2+-binding RTX toxin-like protein